MFVTTLSIARSPRSLRAATLVSLFAFTFWASGLPAGMLAVNADGLESVSDTISTSVASANANHTIVFTTPSGVPADGSTIVVTIPTGFNVGSITEDDVDIEDDGTDLTTGAACGAVEAAVDITGQDITFEICNGGGGAIAAASEVTIKIGTNATDSGTGANQIVNHASPGSYVVSIGGTMADAADTRIVIIDEITVTATVNTSFTFSVNGVDQGVTVNDDVTVTSGTSTATEVPFGVVAPGTPKLMAQELRVDTNAVNGFAVTVQADTTLTAGNGATIDTFIEGADTASTTLWAIPSGIMGNPNTYGHWGITSDDDAVSGASSTQWGIGEAAYRGDFVSNPVEVFYHNTAVENDAGVGVGSTTVAYKVQITALQEAATDYQAQLMYIATPVF